MCIFIQNGKRYGNIVWNWPFQVHSLPSLAKKIVSYMVCIPLLSIFVIRKSKTIEVIP